MKRLSLMIQSLFDLVFFSADSDNGRILWRHKFEEDPAVGRLRRLAVLGRHVATVSGAGPLFLRMWDPIKGALLQVGVNNFV